MTLPAAGRGGNANWGRPALFAAMNGGRGAAFGAGPGFSRQGPPPFREPGTRSPAEAAKALIAAGADPNVWSWPDNSPPIHRAAALGNIDLIKTLVSAGAKLDSWDNDGNTPLQIAERTNTPEAIKRAEDAVIAAVANGTPMPARGAPPQEVVNLIRELMGLPPEAPKDSGVPLKGAQSEEDSPSRGARLGVGGRRRFVELGDAADPGRRRAPHRPAACPGADIGGASCSGANGCACCADAVAAGAPAEYKEMVTRYCVSCHNNRHEHRRPPIRCTSTRPASMTPPRTRRRGKRWFASSVPSARCRRPPVRHPGSPS